MNPTSFFLLTLLLVLVTEPAVGRPRERFSQTSEDQSSSETSEITATGGSLTEEVYEERKYKHTGNSGAGDKMSLSAGELERSYTGRKERQRFAQEIGK
ncbi:seminal vesicle secretory protein 6-like [Cricetulus griseus]|uniref:Seminal vesicle secretory protein 6 n=1 Tax=Cricetulus griseus TaxID=10029 RepID=A0A8C2MDY3_CRIGR|nr:seminal vesicle secretory protein 6-like [Cricetulus griseus]XP_027293885.1 seminal vesicle secretory protein 6-like [Cricetulus griseus]